MYLPFKNETLIESVTFTSAYLRPCVFSTIYFCGWLCIIVHKEERWHKLMLGRWHKHLFFARSQAESCWSVEVQPKAKAVKRYIKSWGHAIALPSTGLASRPRCGECSKGRGMHASSSDFWMLLCHWCECVVVMAEVNFVPNPKADAQGCCLYYPTQLHYCVLCTVLKHQTEALSQPESLYCSCCSPPHCTPCGSCGREHIPFQLTPPCSRKGYQLQMRAHGTNEWLPYTFSAYWLPVYLL